MSVEYEKEPEKRKSYKEVIQSHVSSVKDTVGKRLPTLPDNTEKLSAKLDLITMDEDYAFNFRNRCDIVVKEEDVPEIYTGEEVKRYFTEVSSLFLLL